LKYYIVQIFMFPYSQAER